MLLPREQGKERPLCIPQMVQAGWDARPASRDGSEPMAMHKISSVPAAGHGSGLVRSGVAARPRP